MRTFALSVITALFLAAAATATAETDVTAPELSDVRLTNKIFKVGAKNTVLLTQAKKKRKTPTGTTIKFNLEENAYVAIAVFRAAAGREQGTDCVKPTPELENAKTCVRPVFLKTMERIGRPGPNAIGFSGRLDGQKLKVGAYAFGIIVSDLAGNQSPLLSKYFFIVKG
ncbi:MAG: hypothetical protein JHD02_03480 [Thermoleophilaceae bacterium]|nr:hypothetical protein [Thermoleophilaceae bacterium]